MVERSSESGALSAQWHANCDRCGCGVFGDGPLAPETPVCSMCRDWDRCLACGRKSPGDDEAHECPHCGHYSPASLRGWCEPAHVAITLTSISTREIGEQIRTQVRLMRLSRHNRHISLPRELCDREAGQPSAVAAARGVGISAPTVTIYGPDLTGEDVAADA